LGQVKAFSPQNGSQKKLPQAHTARQSGWQLKTDSPHDGSQKPSPHWQKPLQSIGQLNGSSKHDDWQVPSPQAHVPQSVGHTKGFSPQSASSQMKLPHAQSWRQSP
jgi:hypothetical protein